MKKILFASTALVAFGGAAAAEVALSGRAEIGIVKTSSFDAQFFQDIDVTFTMSGETDNGLTFGASVDLDEGGDGSDASDVNTEDGGATVFISGSFGTVTMGDTDGAMDWALTEAGNVGNPGSINDDETEHAGHLGAYLDGFGNNDGQILRYDFTAGDFGVAISLESDDGVTGNTITGTQAATTGTDGYGFAIGLKYNLDLSGTDVALGLGYQEAEDGGVTGKAVGISASATFNNGLSAGITYTDFDKVTAGGQGVDNHVGIGVGYSTGALSLHANYGTFDVNDGSGNRDGFGVAAAYDLGGGAVVHFGYGDSTRSGADAKTASLGLGLSF